jgi:4,5-DOPA dioxygenase extradiol
MSIRLDPIFVSHGAPTLARALAPGEAAVREAMDDYGRSQPKPRAIVVASAHWLTEHPRLSAAEAPETVPDFGGFPKELYTIRYPAPGSPAMARRAADLLGKAGFSVDLDPSQGLDHGAWVPLSALWPDADVPVLQLSVQPRSSAAHHLAVGRALQPLVGEGVLIVGSGGAVHSLGQLNWKGKSEPHPWAIEFDDWIAAALAEGRIDDAVAFERLAPHAREAHPSTEHFLPLFVPLGAAGESARGVPIHRSWTYGSLSMAAYRFGATGP